MCMQNLTIRDIEPGTSWACRFKTNTFLDSQGVPVTAKNLQLGQAHPGTPGEYTSIGVVQIRDLENELVQLQDTQAPYMKFTVPWSSCWAIDRVEWQE